MTKPLLRSLQLLTGCCLLGTATAQLPTDAVVVLEATTNVQDSNYRLVDLFGRGSSTIGGQNVFLQPPPVSVTTDPNQPGNFWFQANPSSLAGTWRYSVGSLARINQAVWGAWLRTAGERVESGSTQVFTLRGGVVESCLKSATAPQTPVVLFTLGNAIDLAVKEPFLYVASFDPSAPSPLVEYNLGTGSQRTVGTYVGVRAIAASPVTSELLLGTATGELTTIAIATGAVVTTVNPGLGPIVAVGFSRFGTRVYANSTELWSEVEPTRPIYVSSRPIVDFGVTQAPTASVATFGSGCGRGLTTSWAATGLPTLGNTTFELGLRSAPASSAALLALGTSRTVAPQLGVALPYDLQLYGAPGCLLLVDPQVFLLRITNGAGDSNVTVPIPNAPSLAGAEFTAQWFVPDPSTGSLGLASTEGVAFVIR